MVLFGILKPMEPENFNSVNEQKGRLQQVTPLSKYLAMMLFILLPFLGGWIGYMYSPEKTTYIVRYIQQDAQDEEVTDELDAMSMRLPDGEVITVTSEFSNREISFYDISPNEQFIYYELVIPSGSDAGTGLFIYDISTKESHPIEFIDDQEQYETYIDLSDSIFDLRHYSGSFSGWSTGIDDTTINYLNFEVSSGIIFGGDGIGHTLYYKSVSAQTPWIISPQTL